MIRLSSHKNRGTFHANSIKEAQQQERSIPTNTWTKQERQTSSGTNLRFTIGYCQSIPKTIFPCSVKSLVILSKNASEAKLLNRCVAVARQT
jgi:hypothetical protein